MFYIFWYLVSPTYSYANEFWSDFTTNDTIFNWYDPLELQNSNKNYSSKYFRPRGSHYYNHLGYKNFYNPFVDLDNVSKQRIEYLYEKHNLDVTQTPIVRLINPYTCSSKFSPYACFNIHSKNLDLASKEFDDLSSNKLLYEAIWVILEGVVVSIILIQYL